MVGLASAAQQLQSYGRGPDTMLAHIAPDEAALIDRMQGGRRTNPVTGLPEYGMFGKILKGIARAAGAIGGFMVGGPAGAALGSAAATKLTGGSWKQAGLAGALGGLGAGVGNMAAGTGFMGTGGGLAGAASNSVPLSQLGGLASQTVLPTGLAGSLAAGTSAIGGLGGLGAGVGGFLGEPRDDGGLPPQGPPPVLDQGITYNPNQLSQRQYVPFTGDYSKYGLEGGEHAFYRPTSVNVPGLSIGDNHPEEIVEMARGGRTSLYKSASRRAARRALSPGRVSGPSDGSGMDDRVPAMLTDGEHVIDKESVDIIGGGNNDRGHARLESMKRAMRKSAGIPKPYLPAAARAERAMKRGAK